MQPRARRAGHREQPTQADLRDQQGRDHQRQGEHQADARAHQGHRLGANLVAGLVGQQGGDRGGHGAGALQGAAGDQPAQGLRPCRHEAAGCEHQQAEDDHALAAQPVRGHAEGDLQDALGQAIDAHGQADQGGVGAARVSGRLQREHRKDQEQAEHARGKDGRQRAAGTAFHRRHAGGGGGNGGCIHEAGSSRNRAAWRPGKPGIVRHARSAAASPPRPRRSPAQGRGRAYCFENAGGEPRLPPLLTISRTGLVQGDGGTGSSSAGDPEVAVRIERAPTRSWRHAAADQLARTLAAMVPMPLPPPAAGRGRPLSSCRCVADAGCRAVPHDVRRGHAEHACCASVAPRSSGVHADAAFEREPADRPHRPPAAPRWRATAEQADMMFFIEVS